MYVHSSSGRYGADRQLALIASGLDRSRFEPTVVVPSRGPLVDDLEGAGVEVLVRPLAVIRRELANAGGAASLAGAAANDAIALRKLIRSRGVALVHSNTSVVLSGAAAAAAARVPHVWHVREIYARYARPWPVYRRVLQSARALPCVSAATAAQFSGSRARVIHDGLATDPSRAARPAAREALRLPPDVPVIAVLGRISDWKGQDVLVRALASPELRQRGAVGLVAGDVWPGAEDRRQAVVALAHALGVGDRIVLAGFRDDIDNVYGAADVVAVPSTAPDPLPGSAVEAAAAGCAVIAAAHGGLPEIVHDGDTGVLVVPGDAGALARAAAALIDDPARCQALGEAASRDVRKRFAPDRLLHSIQALYDELL